MSKGITRSDSVRKLILITCDMRKGYGLAALAFTRSPLCAFLVEMPVLTEVENDF